MLTTAKAATPDRRHGPGARPLRIAWLVILLATFGGATAAQVPGAGGIPVRLEQKELFRIHSDLGPFTAEERARVAEEKIHDLAFNPFRPAGEYELRELGTRTDVVYAGATITTVTPEDAEAEGLTTRQVAERRLEVVRQEVALVRSTLWNPRRFLLGLFYALLFTTAFFLVVRQVGRQFGRSIASLEGEAPLEGPLARVGPAEVLRGLQIRRLVARLLRGLRVLAFLTALAIYVPVTLSFFPRTSYLTQEIVGHILEVLATVWAGLVGYFPKLLFLVVVATLTYYGIRIVKVFFDEVRDGAIALPNFDPDWAGPTFRIVAFLLVSLVLVVAFPYLPGSQTEAFKAVSIFLGLVVSLASSSAVSNVIAGVILTYTSAFRIGDRVKIADTVGDVVTKTLLVTRVRTIKNVDIAIPNALVLTSHIVNYSKEAQGSGVILHTSVTIGYNVPWRQVEALLVAAALDTEDILGDPRPFVLQTSLSDFAVTYEINAYTRNPWRMAVIYSDLHASIQDRFNAAGVEIMSPHYTALRDGNASTVPSEVAAAASAEA